MSNILYYYYLSLRSQLRVVMSVAMYRIKTMFGSTLHPVVCRLIRVLFELFVFVCVQWCPSPLDYMSYMAGVLYETETAYPSRAPGSSPGFGGFRVVHHRVLVGSVLFIPIVFCVVFFVLFCLTSSCVLCAQCCQCLQIFYS